MVSPIEVWPYVLRGRFLATVMVIAALTGYGRTYEGPDVEQLREPPFDVRCEARFHPVLF